MTSMVDVHLSGRELEREVADPAAVGFDEKPMNVQCRHGVGNRA